MADEMLKRIEQSLTEKRQNIYHWLETAPAEEKEMCLCEDNTCVQPHMQVIETALEKAENKTLGICKVCNEYVNQSLLEMDYTSNVCLDHFSPEERRRLEDELELSQIVQRALMPQQMPSVPGLELAAFSRPAEILGGDYFDFFHFNSGSFGVAIADVVGHGVSASILMSSLQTALRTMVPQSDSPAEVLQNINHFYIHNINLTTFITAFLAHYDAQNHILTYSNAGHTSPLVIQRRADKEVWLKPTNAAIGLSEAYNPQPATAKLSPDDILLLYTDGITEVMNPNTEQFGMQRLADLVKNNSDLAAQDLVSVIRQAINRFSAGRPMADDATMVAIKINQ